jgi:hypothetical protein
MVPATIATRAATDSATPAPTPAPTATPAPAPTPKVKLVGNQLVVDLGEMRSDLTYDPKSDTFTGSLAIPNRYANTPTGPVIPHPTAEPVVYLRVPGASSGCVLTGG